MTLPPRIPKKPKRETRWRSRAHCDFVRSHACCACYSTAAIEVAHLRLGSGAGMGQKPDDWRTVSLCRECHAEQHSVGEESYWELFRCQIGTSVHELIEGFCKASPKASEIKRIRQEAA